MRPGRCREHGRGVAEVAPSRVRVNGPRAGIQGGTGDAGVGITTDFASARVWCPAGFLFVEKAQRREALW